VCADRLSASSCDNEFDEPVDTDRAPDYLSMIKNPMDLSALSAGVKKGKYPYSYDGFKLFRDDVQLIWDNCMEYNGTGSEYHKLATTFRDKAIPFLDALRNKIHDALKIAQ
jgi:Bromodomain